MQELTFEYQAKNNQPTFYLKGALTRSNVMALWHDIKQFDLPDKACQVNLSQVDKIDSAGIVLLIHLIEHAKSYQCHVILTCVSEDVITLLRLAHIEHKYQSHIQQTK